MPTEVGSLRKNAVLKALLNIFNLLVPLLVGPYVNALLAPEKLGLYNRALAECQLFLLLGAFGIYNFGVRELSRVRGNKEAEERTFSALFIWGIISNAVAVFLYAIFFIKRAPAEDWLLYSVLLIQIIGNVFYVEFMNEATENYFFITCKTIVIRTLYAAAIFLAVRQPTDVVEYALVISVTIFLNNIISYFYVKKNIKLRFKNLNLQSYIVPLLVSLLIVNVEVLYAQADRILLAPFGYHLNQTGDVLVTLYTLPFTLVGMLASVPTALLAVALPRLSNMLGQNNFKDYNNYLQKITEIFLAMLIPLCMGVAVVAPEIMDLYTGGVYTYAWPILVVASFGRIVYGLQFIISSLILYLHQQEKLMAKLLLICGVLNLFFKAILIKLNFLTPITTMLTTLLAVSIYIAWTAYLVRQQINVEWKFFNRRIFGYVLAGSSFFLFRYILSFFNLSYYFNLFVIIILSVVFYGGFIIKSKDSLLAFLLKRDI